MASDKPAFGTPVTVYAIYDRRQRYTGNGHRVKYWHRRPIEKRTGLYIGYRTLSDGRAEWIESEEGIAFYPETHFKSALVVFSARERPVFVPFDALQVNDGRQT